MLVTDRVELVTDEVEPNEFVHFDVNLNKRTCGCAHWQYYGIACKHAILVWEKYQDQLAERNSVMMEADKYLEAFCGRRPTDIYFLAQVFIEAANDLKTNRIKLPCESTYVFGVNKYPPKPLPKARRGAGRPHEKPFRECTGGATTRCGICHQRGHNQLTCEFYEVWFDWKDPNDMVFRNLFTNALHPNGNLAHQHR